MILEARSFRTRLNQLCRNWAVPPDQCEIAHRAIQLAAQNIDRWRQVPGRPEFRVIKISRRGNLIPELRVLARQYDTGTIELIDVAPTDVIL